MGKESLDDLEAMVAPVFEQVANKDVIIPEWLDHPFGPEQLRKIAYVPPVQDTRQLNIMFPLPDYTKYYKIRVSPVKFLFIFLIKKQTFHSHVA